jgi:hypothetical protein
LGFHISLNHSISEREVATNSDPPPLRLITFSMSAQANFYRTAGLAI